MKTIGKALQRSDGQIYQSVGEAAHAYVYEQGRSAHIWVTPTEWKYDHGVLEEIRKAQERIKRAVKSGRTLFGFTWRRRADLDHLYKPRVYIPTQRAAKEDKAAARRQAALSAVRLQLPGALQARVSDEELVLIWQAWRAAFQGAPKVG